MGGVFVSAGLKINEFISTEVEYIFSSSLSYNKNSRKDIDVVKNTMDALNSVFKGPNIKISAKNIVVDGVKVTPEDLLNPPTETFSITEKKNFKYDISALLAKIKIHHISYGELKPYIAFGGGLSNISCVYDYELSDPTKNSYANIKGKTVSDSSLAWSAGTGLSYNISDRLFVDLGYNFVHYGSHELDKDNIFKAHLVKLSVGYSL